MTQRVRRRNALVLRRAGAAVIGLATLGGLAAMDFTPLWGAVVLAVLAGALAAAATEAGVLVALGALSLPIAASNPIVGIAFLAVGAIGVHYLGSDSARAFMVVAGAVAGAFFGPVWAAAALAGYVLGATEGAIAAALAAVTVEALGLALGRESLFATVTGGSTTTTLLRFGEDAPNLLSPAWVQEGLADIGPSGFESVATAVSGASHVLALVAQPALWAAAAVAAGAFAKAARRNRSPVIGSVGAAIAALVPAAGAVALLPAFDAPVPAGEIAIAAASSAAIAALGAYVWDRYFPLEFVSAAPGAQVASVATEDADVDELLRLIATAEERLASDHTSRRVVLITDMKAFSKMTEEDGSVLTAKAIQRHRDLLLPVIERHGGMGKSTGGDGLVAAFGAPAAAVAAAGEMQRLLADHNQSHPHERELTVRMGLAEGEVVLDKRGRPFIGSALNLAARVMALADGGQAFATSDVAAASGERFVSHGEFELKNIARPVEVLELIWADTVEPVSPRDRAVAHE